MAKKQKKEPVFDIPPNDRILVEEEMLNLQNSPGWMRLVKFYDEKIEWIEKVINGDVKSDDGQSIIQSKDELERWRDKRNMAIQFRNLPEILVTVARKEQGEPIDLDPYDK